MVDIADQSVKQSVKPAKAETSADSQAAVFDRFARFYDDDYRAYDADIPAILDLAEETGDPILELGCGTGRVMLPLLEAGRRVTGIDLSPALLAVAQEKLASFDGATLVQADLRDFDLPRKDFAFAVCTSNTLMHFSTPADQLAVLRNAYRHLRPDGLLLIDLFNPDLPRLIAVDGVMELADQWHDAHTGAQVVKWSVRTLDPAAQLQDTLFIYEEVSANGETRRTLCPFLLRYLWRNEAELMLQAAGFRIDNVWGDFDGSPYENGSDHLILLASRSTR